MTTDFDDVLTEGFESVRPYLRGVAYRILGSYDDADDAVQEAWLRLERSGAQEIENVKGWLTTVVASVCLDRLRARKAGRDEPVGMRPVEENLRPADDLDPMEEVVLADAVGSALLVLLDRLEPAERVAFVLHDIFAVSFNEIGAIVNRSAEAARQLGSRARRRLQGVPANPDVELARQRMVVDAFLAAARHGDFSGLLAVLDPDVIFRADDAALRLGAPGETQGADAVARAVMGRTGGARLGLIDGAVGLVATRGGVPLVAFRFAFANGRLAAINMVAEPGALASLDLHVDLRPQR